MGFYSEKKKHLVQDREQKLFIQDDLKRVL